jgi:hypothetical protein
MILFIRRTSWVLFTHGMRTLLVFCLSFLLAGCWVGPEFYTLAQNVQPIPAGKYKVIEVATPFDDDPDTKIGSKVIVTFAPDGRTLMTSQGESDNETPAILVKLDGFSNIYIMQGNLSRPEVPDIRAVYGLVNVLPDGYQLAMPPCDGARRMTGKLGGFVKGPLFSRATCRFDDRTTFEAAMQKFAADPIRWTTYRRVKPRASKSAQTPQR